MSTQFLNDGWRPGAEKPVTFLPVLAWGILDGERERDTHEAFWSGRQWVSTRTDEDDGRRVIHAVQFWSDIPRPFVEVLEVPDGPGWWWCRRNGKSEWEMVEGHVLGKDHVCFYAKDWGGVSMEEFKDKWFSQTYGGEWIRIQSPPTVESTP